MCVGAEAPATGYVFGGWVRVVRGGRGIREEVVTEGVRIRRVGPAFFAEECLGKCRGVLGTKFDFIVRGIMTVRAGRRFPHPRSAVSSSVQLRRDPSRLYYQLRTQQENMASRNSMSMPGCAHLPLEMANITPRLSPNTKCL